MDDREAVAKLKQGDIGGLEALSMRYYRRAVQTAYLVVGDRAQAEDIAQSAFVNAYERIGTFDNTRPFAPWFLRTVAHAAMRVASGRRDLSLEVYSGEHEIDIPDPEPGVEARLEAAETREEMITALRQLSPGQRAAVVLRYYLDLSFAEVSEQLQVPEHSVRRRLHDARKRLLKIFRSDPAPYMWLPPNESASRIKIRKETSRD